MNTLSCDEISFNLFCSNTRLPLYCHNTHIKQLKLMLTQFKKHFILIGMTLSLLFLILAGLNYPGGAPNNPVSIGYHWTENYISNLLGKQALNGMDNTARPWAIVSVFVYSFTLGLFFIQFSKKIPMKSAAVVIQYGGVALTALAFFIVVPSLHDVVVTISSIFTLIVFFYITVMVLKSRLLVFKVLSVCFLLLYYFVCYLYFTRSYLNYLPLMQKIIHLVQLIWVISLHYFTLKKDFEHITQ